MVKRNGRKYYRYVDAYTIFRCARDIYCCINWNYITVIAKIDLEQMQNFEIHKEIMKELREYYWSDPILEFDLLRKQDWYDQIHKEIIRLYN